MKEDRKNLDNISILRALTILVVVLGHSMIVYQTTWGTFIPKNKSIFFNNFKNYIDTFQMPLFIMISGYVYYYSSIESRKNLSLNVFTKKKIKRLFIPYISVAVFFVVPIRLFVNYKRYDNNSFIYIIFKYIILGEDPGNLWYIYTLFFILLIFYILKKIIIKLDDRLLIMIFIVINIISVKLPIVFQLNNVAYYILFFYYGYLIRKYETKNKFIYKSKKIIFMFLAIQLFSMVAFYTTGELFIGAKGLIMLICKTFGMVFYYSIITLISEKNYKLNNYKIIRYFDEKSYSIYLFHPALMYIILYYISDKDIHPCIVVIVSFIIILTISMLIDFIISNVKYMRFIIGKDIRK